MNPSIARACENCKTYAKVEIAPGHDVVCPNCSRQWCHIEEMDAIVDRCPVCLCRQFYAQKDFNQALGCLIMLAGIILVPFTYGLSLPVFALIDWALYRRIPSMVVCYRCHSEFRGIVPPPHLKGFMHHIGMKYDRKR
jgi:hypothetical protein